MAEKAVGEKIAVLTQLMQNPDRKDGIVLRIFYDIFQLTHGGLELPHQTEEWLNQIASRFLSEALLKVLTKLRLEVYGFKFAALNFIDIDDVVGDLSHDASRLDAIIPPGSYNKLKQDLIGQSQNVSKSGTVSPTSVTKNQQQPTAEADGRTNLQFISLDHIVAKPHEPEFKFSCNLCQTKLRSKNDIKSHVKGRNHLSKVNSVQQNQAFTVVPQRLERNDQSYQITPTFRTQYIVAGPPGYKFRCQLCDTKLKSEKDMDNHLNGGYHRKKVEEKNLMRGMLPDDARTSEAFMTDGRIGATGGGSKGFVSNVAVAKPTSNFSSASNGDASYGNVTFNPAPFSAAMKAGSSSFPSIKFERRCNLYHPERASTEKTWNMSGANIALKIVIDTDMLRYLIIAQGTNQQYLCNTMITSETELKVDGTVCTWSVSEYSGMGPFHRSFLAQFSSTDVALEFKSIFEEGIEFAEKYNA